MEENQTSKISKNVQKLGSKLAKVSITMLAALCAFHVALIPQKVEAMSEERGMMLWNDASKEYLNPSKYISNQEWIGSEVYWGNDNDNIFKIPLKWKILNTNEEKFGQNGGVLLQSESSLGKTQFNAKEEQLNYMGSILADYIDNKMTTSLSTQENNATLVSAAKSDSSYKIPNWRDPYNDDFSGKKWFAPTARMISTSDYGYANSAKPDKTRQGNSYYWTSSTGTNFGDFYAGMIDDSGELFSTYVYKQYSAVAATQLNPDSILFVSNADGGKTTNTVGSQALAPVSDTASGEYKFTIKDDDQTILINEASGSAGNIVHVNYTKTGDGTTISAIVLDKAGENILYYGQLENVAAGNLTGEVLVKVPDNFYEDEYQLKVFSENANGDRKTDYASEIMDATPPVPHFTATFDGNGGISNPSTMNVVMGQQLGTLPTATRDGYSFKGWYTEKVDGIQIMETSKMPADNVTYYAQWIVNKYSVKFESNGGTEVPAITGVEHNNKIAVPNEPNKTGYTFTGWYTDKDLKNPWDFATDNVVSDMTLYAGWEKINVSEKPENIPGIDNTDSPSANTDDTANNTNSPSVDTGDTTNSTVYMITLMVSMLGLLIFAVKKYEKKKVNK